MGEVVATFLRFEAVQQRPDPPPRRLNGAFGRVAEQGFEFGEDLFNRVEIGGVGRQEAQRGPHPFNGGPHGRTLMAAQIVQNDDIARSKRWQQTLFDISQEAGSVDRAIKDTRRGNTIVAQRRHEGQGVPVPVGAGRAQPLAAETAAMTTGHVRLSPGLIEEDEAARTKSALRVPPPLAVLRDVRPILLGGCEAFF